MVYEHLVMNAAAVMGAAHDERIFLTEKHGFVIQVIRRCDAFYSINTYYKNCRGEFFLCFVGNRFLKIVLTSEYYDIEKRPFCKYWFAYILDN